jgi:uncharacterized protein YdcH (DUF465 family)
VDTKTRLSRLEYLRTQHDKVHRLIEALEGEKAPEENISHQKKIKLSIKDEIASIENTLKAEGVEYVG